MRYAVVVGEALIDLLETEVGGELHYLPAVGGAPLNVAIGLSRLGWPAEFVGSISSDVFGRRIRDFLRAAGVGERGVVTVEAPTTLAVTAFDGPEPDFHFYGEPVSYGLIRPDDLDPELVRGAAALYCGSICLLHEPALATARRAWAIPGPIKAFDPNVRPHLLGDAARTRAIVEEFVAGADLVKLSAADASALYGASPRAVVDRFVGLGASTVVMTLGADGAMVSHDGRVAGVAGVRVNAVDATGAGDATMAALIAGALDYGVPADLAGWVSLTATAMRVAALVCEAPGGATAMPTREQVHRRFPPAE